MASDSSDSLSPFFVYILRCSDGSLYVGHTSNIENRIKVHNEGRGPTWTASRLPVELVYHEAQPTEQRAVARERQLKRWTHAKKLSRVNGDLAKLKSLAKCRTR